MRPIEKNSFIVASAADRSRFLVQFLFGLTLGFRDLCSGDYSDIEKKLRGLNQINHYVLPFIDDCMSGKNGNYTAEVLMQYIEELGMGYGVEHQVLTAWAEARTRFEKEQKYIISTPID